MQTNNPLPSFLQKRFNRRIAGAKRKHASKKVFDKITADMQAAEACQQRRLENWPTWQWPDLPVVDKLDELKAAIQQHQVVVIAGETGSGKTTQLPKVCLELGLGKEGLIGHTQPRRLAARSVANRIAEELNTQLGEQVGYKVRFEDKSGDHNLICLMTDGMLLSEIQHDRLLTRYQVLIIDEAHERSLNIDFLLGFIKQLLPKRPDLKVIITSATIDHERFAAFFAPDSLVGSLPEENLSRAWPAPTKAEPLHPTKTPEPSRPVGAGHARESHTTSRPVGAGHARDNHTQKSPVTALKIPGRTYPVDIKYRPMTDGGRDIPSCILDVLDEIGRDERQQKKRPLDVLVFLTGERDIRDAHLALKKANLFGTEILPLYARLPPKEQARVFASHKGRRIVLSTNVAETSLTVPGIGYVIDAGTARISRYSVASKVQRLPVEAISQASANQRSGRAGRIMPGVCYRLYEEADFVSRPAFTEPEIQRTNLASVILTMADARLGSIEAFPFLDPPEGRLIRDGYKLLFELSAMNERQQLSKLGRQLAHFPLDPRLGRMLFAANQQGVLREALIIVAALGVQDPCERPRDKQQQASQAHQPFIDKRSDFLFYFNLWEWSETQRAELSRNQYEKQLKLAFLSPRRMREWRETHRQLLRQVREMGWKLNQTPAGYNALHQALLTGLATQVMMRDDKGEWLSCRNRKPVIWPGSSLKKTKKHWLMAAEQVETSRLFGRVLAEIEPDWIIQAVPQLVKYHYAEPQWSKKQENILAKESITLFGLMLSSGKRVSYEKADPALARELMIRHGLVEGELQKPVPFVDRNKHTIRELAAIEHKMRRHDFLVDEEAQWEFYDQALPDDITNLTALRQWYQQASREDKRNLTMTRDFLLARSEPDAAEGQFPNRLLVDNMALKLTYEFDPAGKRDGVTLHLPQAFLGSFPRWRADWLVPGLLSEKIEALLRGLPKKQRRQVVPIPDTAQALVGRLLPQEPLLPAMTRELHRLAGLRVEQESWPLDKLPDYLRMNIRVLDDRDKPLAESRCWEDFDSLAQTAAAPILQEAAIESTGSWVFGDIPTESHQELAGTRVTRYPALVDEDNKVTLREFHDAKEAQHAHAGGLARLFWLQRQDVIKRLQKWAASQAGFQRLQAEKSAFARSSLEQTILLLCKHHLGLENTPPRTEADWNQRLKERLGDAIAAAENDIPHFAGLFNQYRQMRTQLAKNFPLQFAHVHRDISTQLEDLFHEEALQCWPFDWWQQMPRYLAAATSRLDKLSKEDRGTIAELAECRERYQTRAKGLAFWQQDAELQHYRLMLEELRVSLFDQQLGTQFSVSFKRLKKQWLAC